MHIHRQVAESGVDYAAIGGSLVFDEGVTSQSFSLTLLQDTTPEVDEYIFIAITNVQLNESSVDIVDSGALPSVAPGNDSVAFVVISENDDARGVVQLSTSIVQTPEPSQRFISVTRLAGTFGEVNNQCPLPTPIYFYKVPSIQFSIQCIHTTYTVVVYCYWWRHIMISICYIYLYCVCKI